MAETYIEKKQGTSLLMWVIPGLLLLLLLWWFMGRGDRNEIASHGYAVFSIAHPYESIAVAFPDGRVVAVSKTRMDSVGRAMGASARALDRFAASKDPTLRAGLFRQAIAEPRLLHESLPVWTQDTRVVMDELTRLTQGGSGAVSTGVAFSGKLDLSRIGVLGMSFGGTTAGQVCVVEPRCTAGVNLDGTQYRDPIDVPLRVPFMFMTSFIPGLNDPVYERALGAAHSVNVQGSTQFNCTDFSAVQTNGRALLDSPSAEFPEERF